MQPFVSDDESSPPTTRGLTAEALSCLVNRMPGLSIPRGQLALGESANASDLQNVCRPHSNGSAEAVARTRNPCSPW